MFLQAVYEMATKCRFICARRKKKRCVGDEFWFVMSFDITLLFRAKAIIHAKSIGSSYYAATTFHWKCFIDINYFNILLLKTLRTSMVREYSNCDACRISENGPSCNDGLPSTLRNIQGRGNTCASIFIPIIDNACVPAFFIAYFGVVLCRIWWWFNCDSNFNTAFNRM